MRRRVGGPDRGFPNKGKATKIPRRAQDQRSRKRVRRIRMPPDTEDGGGTDLYERGDKVAAGGEGSRGVDDHDHGRVKEG